MIAKGSSNSSKSAMKKQNVVSYQLITKSSSETINELKLEVSLRTIELLISCQRQIVMLYLQSFQAAKDDDIYTS